MVKLADYQRMLMQSLLDPEASSDGLQAIIADPDNIPKRLAIYQNSILGGRFSVLQQIFVCVQKLVGVDYFQQMAEQFLQASPSSHVAIAAMGEEFVRYVVEHDVVQHVPYIADMAALDWRWYQVFHGHSNVAIEAKIIPAAAKWRLALGAKLLASTFPLHLLWEMCQPEYQGEFHLPDDAGEYYFILVQREQAIRIEPVSIAEWQVLYNLSSNIVNAQEAVINPLYHRGCIILSLA